MKTSKKIIYGMSRYGSSFWLGILGFIIYNLYRDYFGLNDLFAGLPIFIGYILIAYSSFHMGYISDKIRTRLGRRKPFIIVGVPLIATCFILLFTPHLFGLVSSVSNFYNFPLFIYLLVFYGAFEFLYGALMTPYQAWLPEIVDEDKEKAQLSVFENVFGIVGNGAGIIMTFLIFPVLLNIKAGETPNFTSLNGAFMMMLVSGIIAAMVFIPAILKIREDESKFIPQPNLRKELKVIWTNKNYIKFLIFQGVASLGMAMVIGNIKSFWELILDFSTTQLVIGFVVFALVILVGLYCFYKLLGKIGKHRTLDVTLLLSAGVLPFTAVIGYLTLFSTLPPSILFIIGMVFVSLAALGLASWYLFPYIVMADIVQKDEIESGESRSAMYHGFQGLPLNIFQAVSTVMTIIIFSTLIFPPIPGLVTGTNKPVSFGYIWWGVLAGIFILAGFIIFQFVQIDFDFEDLKKKHGKS